MIWNVHHWRLIPPVHRPEADAQEEPLHDRGMDGAFRPSTADRDPVTRPAQHAIPPKTAAGLAHRQQLPARKKRDRPKRIATLRSPGVPTLRAAILVVPLDVAMPDTV